MASFGQMSVAVAVDADKRPVGRPTVKFQGVPVEEEREDFREEAIDAAAEAVRDHRGTIDDLHEKLRLAVRRVATRWTGKKPVVDTLIVEV